MLQLFKDFIKNEKIFNSADKILLAVSGGVDSVVMVKLFHDSGLSFAVAHSNFELRANDSNEDELFVERLAKSYNVPFHTIHFKTKAYALEHKLSIQMAARDLRYSWFNQLLGEHGYKYVATAHHLDDQAETFFINLLRGTGISGLHGILIKNKNIIRPLMFATRNMILEYAQKNNITWREDKSNSSRKYLRNKLRIDVLPELQKMDKEFSIKLHNTISHLRDVEKIYHDHMAGVSADLVEKTKDGDTISIDWIYEYEPHDTYLFELLKPYNFTYSVVKEIVHSLDTFSGKVFYSPTHRLLRDRENLIIQALSSIAEIRTLSETYTFDETTLHIEIPICLCMSQTNKIEELPMGKSSIACLDKDKLSFPLKLRRWQKGDWFMPLGLNGRKKVSDFLIDHKISLTEKEKIWLLLSGEDIVWVIGKRIDNRFRITPKTKQAYVVSCIDESGETKTAPCGCSLLFS